MRVRRVLLHAMHQYTLEVTPPVDVRGCDSPSVLSPEGRDEVA